LKSSRVFGIYFHSRYGKVRVTQVWKKSGGVSQVGECQNRLRNVRSGWVMLNQDGNGQATLWRVRSDWIMSVQVRKCQARLDNGKPCLGIVCGIESV
jgi:hypothetical protein